MTKFRKKLILIKLQKKPRTIESYPRIFRRPNRAHMRRAQETSFHKFFLFAPFLIRFIFNCTQVHQSNMIVFRDRITRKFTSFDFLCNSDF